MKNDNVKFKMLLLAIVFIGNFCAFSQAFATTYYVSSSAGRDTNNGQSTTAPWQTIAKVNSTVFVSGDQILFRSNDEFLGQINLNQSGLTLGSYGAGSKPIITGAQLLTGWTAYGSFYVAQASATVKNLFANGAQMTLARYPNSGFLPIATTNGLAAITAAGINQASGYWNNANVRIRTTNWSFETRTVASYDGTTLNLSSHPDYTIVAGWGFYVDNVLAALGSPGEWYCDPATNLVYFWAPGSADPNTLTIYGSTTDYGVNSSQSNIIAQGLEFRYQAQTALRFTGTATNVQLLSNTISRSGVDGIQFPGSSASCTVDGNTLHDINSQGITFANTHDSMVSNNVIQNIGLVQGYGKSGFGGMIGISIYAGSNNVISGNTVDSTGYDGILPGGTYNLVENNVITNTTLKLADGGAIYTSNASGQGYYTTIQSNIISNVVGNLEGAPTGSTWKQANGIYLDFASHDMIVTNNTISHVESDGFFVQYNDYHNTFSYNTLSDCGNGPGGYFMYIDQHSDATYGQNTVTYNKFYPANVTQKMVYLLDNSTAAMPYSPGTFDYNYYANPYHDNAPFVTCTYPGGTLACHAYSFAQWQTSTGLGLDAHSYETVSTSPAAPAGLSVQ